MINRLRTWWQVQTGEDETPLDGDAPAWLTSLLFHVAVLVALFLIPLLLTDQNVTLTLSTTPVDIEEPLELPTEFAFSDAPSIEIGAHSVEGTEQALSEAPIISEVSIVPSLLEMTPVEYARLEINDVVEVATGLNFNANHAVKGYAGAGETGATGAIDRITHEILLSLEERKTLVVWLFDQSPSMVKQREEVNARFDRIYEELGVIEAAGNPAFAKHESKPLLTSVVAFGKNVTAMTQNPTDNLSEIKAAVEAIEWDTSGLENVFSAVYMSANQYRNLRVPNPETREPERNVMIVVFSDEIGDDQQGLEETIKLCRRYEMPTYIVGVPAPFGRRTTLVKWVDPDPQYDQTPGWGEVNQGPESFLPERVKLHFSGSKMDDDPIDSGFGPFSLTRLAYETGGIYFAVHPNRSVTRDVGRNEVAVYSAHIKRFFDPEIMRKYRPDYVAPEEYMRRLAANKARASLVKASEMSWLAPLESPTLRFVKRSEADLQNALSDAQKDAAKLEPAVNQLTEMLKLGEGDREKETSLRWQAGYDLAMGRVMAVKARTEAYNAMLAQAKTMAFKNEKNNTWVLKPADVVSVGSTYQKTAERAKFYLERVVTDHPGTPWALLAQQELNEPIGWEWTETYTDLNPRPEGMGNGNAPAPADDARRMLEKPAPKRAVPKL